MRHLAKTLYYWLATSEKTSASAGILSCSENAITLSRSSALQKGEIFVHVQQEQLCKSSDCSVLFREILDEDEEGVFPTRPATFSQVFPPDTFHAELADVSIESVLPPCAEMEEVGIATTSSREEENGELSVMAARRSLQAPAAAPAAVPVETPSTLPVSNTVTARSAPEDASIARGKDKYEDDDKYYHDDDKYYYDDDKHYYDDDRYHPPEEPKRRQFLNAVKKLLYDLYCIIRNLQCEEWNPGQEDVAATAAPTNYETGNSKDDKNYRRMSNSLPKRKIRGGVRGLQADISFSDTDITTASSSSSTVPSTVTINTPDGGSVTKISGGGFEGSSTTTTAATKGGKSKSKDDEDDEAEEVEATDDVTGDDFFDDDLAADDGGNFRAFIDTIFEFGRTVWCIFRPCIDDTTTTTTNGQVNNGYDDDGYNTGDSKDKEKHVRWLRYAP